jgi:glycerate-2-kinase
MFIKNELEIIKNGRTEQLKQLRKDIIEVLKEAVESVDPYNAVKLKFFNHVFKIEGEEIDFSDFKNIYLVGFGKASIGMAQAVCDSIDIDEGVVVTNDSTKKVNHENVITIVGSHPIPAENSVKGADLILDLVSKCSSEDLLIVLISGGGSALLCKPRVDLKDLQVTTDFLLKSGANINEINTIRKHISFVKGGQLIKNVKSQVLSLIISDIIGDPIQFIASGPTFPDSTTFNDAKKILDKYGLWAKIPQSVVDTITRGLNGDISETPKDDNLIFTKVHNFIVANNKIACDSAVRKAEELGYKTIFLTSHLEGEAKDMGFYLIDRAINFNSLDDKIMFISSGEPTVTIKGTGKGGRNQEMVLSSVKHVAGKKIVFTSFATDGIDGNSDAAGAIADTFTLKRANDIELDPEAYLSNNDSYNFFKRLDDLLITGTTGTNVMDIQLLIKSI